MKLNSTAVDNQAMSNIYTLEQALNLNRQEVKEAHKKYVNSSLAKLMSLLNFDLQYVKASGVSVWDSEGREYLDFLGGYGSLNLGHNHPRVIQALEKVQNMPNILQASLGTLAGALAANLAHITPGKLQRCFFGNSGAEAVEGALKLARAATGRDKIIYCRGSFHGKTFGALSVTGREKYQRAFQPLLPGTVPVPFGDLDALSKLLKNNDTAAFIVEPIQGEGGINLPPAGYLAQAKELCSRHGALFIADEIQTGMGRTGSMFACEQEGVVPDILCLAKSLGGGIMPIGAYITTDEIWQRAYGSVENATLHTSTFGGNTWAAAAALATIETIYRQDLITQAREKGSYFLRKLKKLKEKYPLLADVRGRGLLIGIEFAKPKGFAYKATMGVINRLSEEYMGSLVAGQLLNKYGIITAYTLNNPNVIRLEPPLVVEYRQLDRVVEALDEILSTHRGFFSMAASGAKTMLKTFTFKD
ncbi:putrescine aminotransferase [Desulfohalotomaculum tongense]|uniref:aspartate aminotransferase family protein n=1 Tax=Desulforadius tongensis TaxID=1216062 RepID=UPI00195BCE8B|nr:aspartate aminotransferase family protein [Desulforadius tongensis]MBM7854378.1 putrescine aminotransferase [Desulforadius tongensis]